MIVLIQSKLTIIDWWLSDLASSLYLTVNKSERELIAKSFLQKSVFSVCNIILQEQKTIENWIYTVWFLVNLLGIQDISENECLINQLVSECLSEKLLNRIIDFLYLKDTNFIDNDFILAECSLHFIFNLLSHFEWVSWKDLYGHVEPLKIIITRWMNCKPFSNLFHHINKLPSFLKALS